MDALSILKQSELQFGATTFFARLHKGDTCGSNGLPLTPNSIIIYGKAQVLRTFWHPYLCQYLDVIRGKHERMVVVSQYCGVSLSECIGKVNVNVRRVAFQITTALNELHRRKIVHRMLSAENVLLQETDDVKLFNYGLYEMTGCGKLVSFPLVQLIYTSPEVYLAGPESHASTNKCDVWSLGIILAELVLNQPLWANLKLGQKIRKVLSLVQCNTSIFERIAREHNCYEVYENLDADLKELIEDCLQVQPKDRPDCNELLKREIFKDFKVNFGKENVRLESIVGRPHFSPFTIKELYHWWQLAGGDVLQELKKQGLIRSTPPILSLPSLVLIEGTILGQERNPTTLYDPRIVQMPLDALYTRLKHLEFEAFHPDLHTNSAIIKNSEAPAYDAKNLPLIIREKDPEYQFHRIILLRRILYGYPYTRQLILRQAEIDIPPMLRGPIWAALLYVKGDYKHEYKIIDKETPTITDRQIEVDIPRCHQYNELLSSAEGHKKLKRILKAWVYKNSHYVYWQGLDSLTAPFLFLNFNNEAKAFACLSAFVPKYLHKFFLKDNSAIIQEYLAKFSQLIAYHDPVLANHLHNINFIPELFAIPWFLTMFSHVFPLHKILHLWDKLLLGDSSFPLHIGLSVLTQLRPRLLASGFNECILLFSDLPEVDIEKCVKLSTNTYASTPKSITTRVHQNREFYPNPKTEFDLDDITLKELHKERCARISATDVVDLVRNRPNEVIIVDIRNPTQYHRCSVIGSINIPFSSVTFGEAAIESLGVHGNMLCTNSEKNVVIVGSEDTDLDRFPTFLLECNIHRVSVLHKGFNVLLSVTPTILTTQNTPV